MFAAAGWHCGGTLRFSWQMTLPKNPTTFPKHLKFTLFRKPGLRFTQKNTTTVSAKSPNCFFLTCLTGEKRQPPHKKGPRDYQPRVGETQTLHFSEHIYSNIPVGFSEPFEPKWQKGMARTFFATKKKKLPSFWHSLDIKQHPQKKAQNVKKKKVAQQKIQKQKISVSLDLFFHVFFFPILHPNNPPQWNGPLGPTLQSHLPPPSHDDASVPKFYISLSNGVSSKYISYSI